MEVKGEVERMGDHSERMKKIMRRPEMRAKIREAAKRMWTDPKYREKVSKSVSETTKNRWANPEYREKMSRALKKGWADPEVRKRASESHKKALADPEKRKQMAEVIKNHSEAMKKMWTNLEYRKKVLKAQKKAWTDPELKKRVSEAIKKAFERPEVKAKRCGPNHPNWKGGSTAPYCWNWPTIREFVRDRDLHRCVLCRANGGRLAAHHINFEKENCPPENAITLCPKCHGRTVGFKGEEIRIASMKVFYPMLKDLYGYEYDENWTPLPSKLRWPSEAKRVKLAKKYGRLFEEALQKIQG